MKQVLFLTAFALSGFASMAQLTFAPRIGVGLTSSAYSETESGLTVSIASKAKINGNIGVEARYRITDILSIHSGLFYDYIQAGNALSVDDGMGDAESESLNTKMNFISIPLQLVYGKEGVGFYGGAGLNFSYGIGGTFTASAKETDFGTTTIDTTFSQDIKFDGNPNSTSIDNNFHLKAFNIGIALKAGYTFQSNIFVGADAVFGLSNLYANDPNDTEDEFSYKLTTFGVHVGYILGSSKK